MDKVKNCISALFYLNLGAVIAFLPFNSNFNDLFLVIIETIGSVFLFSWAVQIVFELFTPAFGGLGITTILVVVPFACFLAIKFNTRMAHVLIGAGAMYVALFLFAYLFMGKFNNDIAIDNDRQNFECIYKSSFREIVVNSGKHFIQQPHAIGIKNGKAYLWSFQSLSFVDPYDEPSPDTYHTCEN